MAKFSLRKVWWIADFLAGCYSFNFLSSWILFWKIHLTTHLWHFLFREYSSNSYLLPSDQGNLALFQMSMWKLSDTNKQFQILVQCMIIQLSLVPMLLTWRSQQFPQTKDFISQDHTLFQMPGASPGQYPVLLTNGYNSEVPTTPPWGELFC